MKPPFDVAIAGSGPAGAACALRLARAGASAILIDQREFPRDKLCGEYLNLGAIRELQDLRLSDILLPMSQPLDGMRLFAHGESATFALPAQAWSIPRTILDAEIRDAALRAGAQTLHGRVRSIEARESELGIEVVDASGEPRTMRARYLVGADGMRSTVGRLCALTAPVNEQRFAVGAHYRGVELGRWIEMYASPHEYIALNPLDATSANAVFVLHKQRLHAAKGRLYEELAAFSAAVTGGRRPLAESGFQSKCHAIGPLAHRTIRPIAPRVLLVGDAAAFVDPFTGQGVYLALAGARDAAAAILSALQHEQNEPGAWERYAAALRRRIAERRRVALMMKAMLGIRFAARRAARALRARPHDFVTLIDAVCGNRETPDTLRLAAEIGKALR